MRYQEDSEAGLDINYISDQKNLDDLEDDDIFCQTDDDEIEDNESSLFLIWTQSCLSMSRSPLWAHSYRITAALNGKRLGFQAKGLELRSHI